MSDRARRLVLTNDDGIDAPGMAALRRAADGLGSFRVVAPGGPQSGCGHRVTTHGPVRLISKGSGEFAVDGTPADCVRLTLQNVRPDVDLFLSGINAGGNLGADLWHSGTVAAVREAVLHGKPGVAISQYIARNRPLDWSRSAEMAARVLADLLDRPWEAGSFYNVNLPHPAEGADDPEVVFCPVDPSPLPLSYRWEGDAAHYDGDYQARPRKPGCDVDVCFGGRIAVSLVRLLPT